MTNRYFENLPYIIYANTVCRDITRRVKIVEDENNSPFVFYPYTLNDKLRSDQVAEYYFDDSNLDWLIYMSNKIIDPYYGWYLDDEKLISLMIEKYGSLETSMKKIIFYRNNWSTDDTSLPVSVYENNLNTNFRKYYEPVWGTGTRILSYKRKEDDTTMNTNRILQYSISANNNANVFVGGELVDISVTGNDTVGTGETIVANSTVIMIKNVAGNTSANVTDPKFIIGETSGANITVNDVLIVQENITEEEGVYWSPVTYFEYEVEINESKRDIKLVDLSLSDFLIDEFNSKVNDDVDPDTNFPI